MSDVAAPRSFGQRTTGLAGYGTCFVGITKRELLKFVNQKERFLAALVRPLIWLFIFAAGFRSTLGVSITPPYDTYVLYEEYVAPGLAVMIQLFAGMQSSLSMVYDREVGSMRVLLTSPFPRWSLLLAKLLAGVIVSVVQVYVFFVIAGFWEIYIPPIGYLVALPAFILSGMMLGSIGLLISSQIRQLENFASVMNFVIFPMFFASSALYPLWKMREASETLYWICLLNPFTHAVELVRFALYLKFEPLSFAVVVGVTIVSFGLSAIAYDPGRGMLARRGGAWRLIVRPIAPTALIVSTLALALLPAAARAQAPGTGVGAGGVPALQPSDAPPAGPVDGNEPARAPGAKADAGTTVLPKANDNSGTTTSYATSAPAEPVQWPCAQRKVSTISAGTIWSGPDVAQGKDWDQDNDVASLAQKLASRRLPLDQADPLIAGFAKQAGADKDKKLTELFVGVLDIINDSRDDILQGIMRYAQGQERLAERMRTESDKISEAQSDVQGPTGVAATETHRDFAWDQRIFSERKQALSYVCETPSLLERRAYEIGKRIQAQL